jgi:hypothetical protein
MSQQNPSSNLLGLMKNYIKKSTNPLTPLYEAISNSIESLNLAKEPNPELTITFHFKGLLDSQKELEDIDITDNGEGFTEEAYRRFQDTFNCDKGFNNRGTGRIQYLHRFENILIQSIFQDESGNLYKRKFTCNKNNYIFDDSCDSIKNENINTTVTLNRLIKTPSDVNFFSNLGINDLQALLLSRFSLRFHLEKSKSEYVAPRIKLIFKHNDIDDESIIIEESDLLTPHSKGGFELKYQIPTLNKNNEVEWADSKDQAMLFNWASFEFNESVIPKNRASLCSKDIEVQHIAIPFINDLDTYNNCRRVVVFYSKYLDQADNVSHAVDKFEILSREEVALKFSQNATSLLPDGDEKYLFREDIVKYATEELAHAYKDFVDMHTDQNMLIDMIARAHGISKAIVKKVNIKLGDSEKTITKKLYEEQSKILAETGYKAKMAFEELRELDPRSDSYQRDIKQKSEYFSTLIDKQNKEELSRYIIRREMVVKLLDEMLNEKLHAQKNEKEGRKDLEGLYHDLLIHH